MRLEDGSPGEEHLALQAIQGSSASILIHSDRTVTLHRNKSDLTPTCTLTPVAFIYRFGSVRNAHTRSHVSR